MEIVTKEELDAAREDFYNSLNRHHERLERQTESLEEMVLANIKALRLDIDNVTRCFNRHIDEHLDNHNRHIKIADEMLDEVQFRRPQKKKNENNICNNWR